MKVERGRGIGTASGKVAPRREGGNFALDDANDTGAARSAGAASPIYAIGALLGLQEVGSGLDDRTAAARGGEILDRLEELGRGLLLGSVGRDRMTQLARISTGLAARTTDPRLRQILAEIELRARVELAKLEMV